MSYNSFMPKAKISESLVDKISTLRNEGLTIKEISKISGCGVGTVCKYLKNVKLTKFAKIKLENKRFPSKVFSEKQKKEAKIFAASLMGEISEREKIIIAIALYWGEGTKKDFNIINGDPFLIRSFLDGILALGVPKSIVRISIRYYDGQSREVLKKYWLNLLDLDNDAISGYEKVASGTKNKLEYGMCRLRIMRPSYYHKVIIALIEILKSPRSSMDRTEAS